ncbi:RHS repeat-associated core domain-containing protein [Delftia acidovorans]
MATYVNDRRAIHEGRNPAMIPGPINPVFPKPQGPPVPILNMAHGPGLKNGTATLKIDGHPVAVAGSRFESIPATPDKVGGIAGVRSGVVGGAAEPTSYSSDTKFESRGSVRSFDTTKSNAMVINPGWAMRLAMKALPGPYDQLAQKVIEKLPGAFSSQLSALGESLTDPSALIGPALKLVGKLIPGVNLVVGGAAMAQAAEQVAELAQEIQELLTPPLTDEKIDQIAEVIADGVAAITIGFVLGKIAQRAKSRRNPVAQRTDNSVNPNTQGNIIDNASKGSIATPPTCELGTCHPVIFATGTKILRDTDFELPGPMALTWQRYYRSSDRRPGWLGWGWSTPLSTELVLVHDAVHYYDARGRRIQLPVIAAGTSHVDPREKITVTHHQQGGWSVESADGTRHLFAPPATGQWRLPLVHLMDRNGNTISLHYPAYTATGIDGRAPRPLGLTDSAGRKLRFTWSEDLGPSGPLLQEIHLESRVINGVEQVGGLLARYAYGTDGNVPDDAHANLQSATDAMGGVAHYRYRQHLMVAYSSRTGFTYHQEWSRLDAGGRVVRTWTDEPGTLDTRFDYDLGRRTTHVTDALGRRSSYEYNARHEVIAIVEPGPDGQPVRSETRMDAAGNPQQARDAMGRTTRWQFDGQGNLLAVTDASGATTRLKYNQLNLPEEVTDALGHVWRQAYDAQGNLVERLDPLGHATRWKYDTRGLPVAIEDALGKTRHLQWDEAGQLVAYTDCSGQVTRYAWDILGNLVASTDALGQTTRYLHDALGRLRRMWGADGSEHHYAYDPQSNLLSYTDPQGAITRYTYNGLDQPVERRDALGGTLRYRYDAVGRLIALQNENGAVTSFTYDAADNLIEETGFDGRIQRYRYNAASELTELHERDAHLPPDTPYDPRPDAALPKRTLFRRDVLGRLVAKIHVGSDAAGNGDGGTTTYGYDLLGRMLHASNPDAHVRFAYDALSRLVEETQVHMAPSADEQALATYSYRHAYDALSNRTDCWLPGGRHVQWLYYGSGHLHQILADGQVLSDIERDALHQEIERTQGTLTSRYGWDPMGRLTSHKVSQQGALQGQPGRPSPQALWDRDTPLPSGQRIARVYQYDPTGNLVATRDGLRGDSQYRYDALGRILAAQKNAAGGSPTSGRNLETFAFDPAGNLLNPNRGGDLSSGGTSNEREQVPTNRLAVYQDLRFQYDLHGNIVERRIGWHTVQRFRYSAEHQMLESTVTRYHDRPEPKIAGSNAQPEPAATVQTTRYRYDALGRRIDKHDAFGRTTFLYDGDLLAGEIRGSRLSEYLYEPDSFVPLAKLESEWKSEENRNAQAEADQASFATYYYHCDQIGAPQELTDETGRIVWAASYKVWGQTQQLQYLRTGTDDAAVFTHDQRPLALAAQGEVQSLALVEQPLRFQGQYFDGETGLHYNRFRYYDPVVGRFVHQDPIGLFGGENFYLYGANPMEWIDPAGLSTHRNRMDRVAGKSPDHQTHHKVPQDIFNKRPILNCIDRHALENLINLPKKTGQFGGKKGKWFGKSTHNTNHNDYSDAILSAIDREIASSGGCPKQLSKRVNEMQDFLHKELKKGTPIMKREGSTFKLWDDLLKKGGF